MFSAKIGIDTLSVRSDSLDVTFKLLLDTTVTVPAKMFLGDYTSAVAPGIRIGDLCFENAGARAIFFPTNGRVFFTTYLQRNAGDKLAFRCFRPALLH